MVNSRIDNKRTKVVATIGPASWEEDTIRRMIRAGMNVARINFSHGDHERHGQTIDTVRRVADEEGVVVTVMCDIQGPKIRIGAVKEPLTLNRGDRVTLTLDQADGTNNVVSLPHPEFVRDIKTGMQLLLDDGNLEFVVRDVSNRALVTEVVIGGTLSSRKGVMAPNAYLTLSAITDKDREDIEFALSKDTDYIAMSFVRTPDDIRELRWLMRHLGGDAAVIAKIEKHEALENIEEIINVCEGIMVARGDLGLETPAEEVPYHQKRIIQLCNQASKPVITATQMLSSMVESPRPTRAEASDVYNAIVDGTDAVMLSNESAAGKYPVESVETMATIATIAEQHVWHNRPQSWNTQRFQADGSSDTTSDAISEAVYHISEALKPKAIITTTLTGYTARRVARERPRSPILCVTPNKLTYRRMGLVWGVIPLLIPEFHTIEEMIRIISQAAHAQQFVQMGDMVIIIAGIPFGVGGQTNLIKVHKIGEVAEL
ncbi:MAG: pyruvate kinase [bacterium]|nr:pyruvate kinase [bacterium]